MKIRTHAIALVAAAGLSAPAHAGGGMETIAVTVDYIPFTIEAARGIAFPVVFDVLSVEATQDGPWFPRDLNKDGEIAFIDSHIHVFRAAPVRGSDKLGELVGSNDDNFEEGFDDGTLYGFDSFLRLNLTAGNYVLAISSYSFSEAEARAGANLVSSGPYTLETNPADEWSNFDHGDYRIRASFDTAARGNATIFDVSGTIFVIPAPAGAMLLGAAGLIASRRRR